MTVVAAREGYPRKLYYRIGEVCEIVGVAPHVLRYWETEFPRLQPPKNKSGQRTYRPKDVDLLLEIRKLLYVEGFTIAGARKKLIETALLPTRPPATAAAPPSPSRAAAPATASANAAAGADPPAQRLDEVRRELKSILTLLERG